MDEPHPHPRCPTCRKPVAQADPHWPFCSPRCRLVDLQKWLGEGYAIPGDPKEPGDDAD